MPPLEIWAPAAAKGHAGFMALLQLSNIWQLPNPAKEDLRLAQEKADASVSLILLGHVLSRFFS